MTTDSSTGLEILLDLIIKKNIALTSTHPVIERVKYMISFFSYSPTLAFNTDNVGLIQYGRENGYTVASTGGGFYDISVPTTVPANIT